MFGFLTIAIIDTIFFIRPIKAIVFVIASLMFGDALVIIAFELMFRTIIICTILFIFPARAIILSIASEIHK